MTAMRAKDAVVLSTVRFLRCISDITLALDGSVYSSHFRGPSRLQLRMIKSAFTNLEKEVRLACKVCAADSTLALWL